MEGHSKKVSKNGTTKKKSSRKLTSSTSGSSEKKASSKKKSVAGKKKTLKKTKSPKAIDSSDDDDDVFQMVAAAADTNSAPTPTPSLPLHELQDPDEMLKSLQKDMKTLKLEAKSLFDEMEDAKRGNDQASKEILEVKRAAQLEKLKGNELVRVDHLLRLGFDAQVMKEHLVAANKELRQEVNKKQKDVNNIGANVQKMVAANKESEKAVTAAHGAYGPLVVQNQTLQAKLDQADVELYAIETKGKSCFHPFRGRLIFAFNLTVFMSEPKVTHRRNMKAVEIMSKDKFKDTIKEIVRKLQIRCRDHELLKDVLRKAGKKLDKDLSLSPVERARLTPKKETPAKNKPAISPAKVSKLRDTQQNSYDSERTSGEESAHDSESISISSSNSSSILSSVEVSSVES
jgi:hypothetical protein